jgi:hypothetical protein
VKIAPLDAVDGLGVLLDRLVVVPLLHGDDLAGREIKALDADGLAGVARGGAAAEQGIDRVVGLGFRLAAGADPLDPDGAGPRWKG